MACAPSASWWRCRPSHRTRVELAAGATAACQKRPAERDLNGMDFDDMDFDDEMFDVGEDDEATPDPPSFRAAVQRSGAIRLVPWWPWLKSNGPAYTLMGDRDKAGITIADLRVIRDDQGAAREVIVELHTGGGDTHRAALCDWAQTVGYRRVWFDDEVIDLEPSAGGPVTTRCTGCGQRFADGHGVHFWRRVRHSGAFPMTCPLCGADLPQWTPDRRVHVDQTKRHTPAHEDPAHIGDRGHRR